MKLALIAAADKNNVIGINNNIPWDLPEDLGYFKKITMGKPIVMGRKTFDSLHKPLPGRTNIVITRDSYWKHDGVEVAHSLEAALAKAKDIASINGNEEVMVIGGEQIFRQSIDRADTIYLTRIDLSFKGDAFFPEVNTKHWQQTSCLNRISNNDKPFNYSHLIFDRK